MSKSKMKNPLWLAVEITENQRDKVNDFCERHNVVKSHLVRQWIEDLEVYEEWKLHALRQASRKLNSRIKNRSINL